MFKYGVANPTSCRVSLAPGASGYRVFAMLTSIGLDGSSQTVNHRAARW